MAKPTTHDDEQDDGSQAAAESSAEREADEALAGGKLPAQSPEDDPSVLRDRWLRARADLENVRRRARLDVDEARLHGTSALLSALLPLLDALQRALGSAGPEIAPYFVQGVQLAEQQLQAVLAGAGVTPISAAPGDAFDPARHRALVEQPSGAHPPGTIVLELVRGYLLHDRLLREAQVAVAKAPDAPST